VGTYVQQERGEGGVDVLAPSRAAEIAGKAMGGVLEARRGLARVAFRAQVPEEELLLDPPRARALRRLKQLLGVPPLPPPQQLARDAAGREPDRVRRKRTGLNPVVPCLVQRAADVQVHGVHEHHGSGRPLGKGRRRGDEQGAAPGPERHGADPPEDVVRFLPHARRLAESPRARDAVAAVDGDPAEALGREDKQVPRPLP
jgi:hypothetical protein